MRIGDAATIADVEHCSNDVFTALELYLWAPTNRCFYVWMGVGPGCDVLAVEGCRSFRFSDSLSVIVNTPPNRLLNALDP